MFKMEDKTFIFKCGQKDLKCNGEHPFILNDEVYRFIIDRMIFLHNLKVDKEMIFSMINKFDNYVEEKYKENQKDTSKLSHFYSIDIYSELIVMFCEKEFGELTEKI